MFQIQIQSTMGGNTKNTHGFLHGPGIGPGGQRDPVAAIESRQQQQNSQTGATMTRSEKKALQKQAKKEKKKKQEEEDPGSHSK